MEWNDEDVLNVEQAVVEPGAGQKAAGWMLRACGLLMFLFGALVVLIGLVAVVLDVFMGSLRPSAMVLGRLAVLELGGVLMMMFGSRKTEVDGNESNREPGID